MMKTLYLAVCSLFLTLPFFQQCAPPAPEIVKYSQEMLDGNLLFFGHDGEGKIVETYFVQEVGMSDFDFGEIKSIYFSHKKGKLEVHNAKGLAARFELDGKGKNDETTEIFSPKGVSYYQVNKPQEKMVLLAKFSHKPDEGCQSGGEGATSCSHSNMGRICKVSCAEGYFACCSTGGESPCLCVPADDFK